MYERVLLLQAKTLQMHYGSLLHNPVFGVHCPILLPLCCSGGVEQSQAHPSEKAVVEVQGSKEGYELHCISTTPV